MHESYSKAQNLDCIQEKNKLKIKNLAKIIEKCQDSIHNKPYQIPREFGKALNFLAR